MSSEPSASKIYDTLGDGYIKKLVEAHWGIRPDGLNRLMGYEVATFALEVGTERFILKQYPAEAELEKRVLFENKVLGHLSRNATVPCPQVLRTLDDAEVLRDRKYVFRLQTYLKGTFLAEATLTPSLLSSIGGTLGRMDKALEEIRGPFPVFDPSWDLQHSTQSESLLEYILDPADRRVATYFLHQFKAEVLPKQYDLPVQLIYGDANEWNILTDGDAVNGIIDFGDICYSWRINEMAIGLAYALMFSQELLADASHLIAGYHSTNPLKPIEIEVLYYLVAARLCISVCWSAKNKSAEPENEYYTISEDQAWKLLHRWIRINPLQARNTFKKATGIGINDDKGTRDLVSRRNQFFSSTLSVSYDTPIHMVRSALQYMYDARGNTYLDAYNNIMLVGHSHPKVVEAGMSTYSRLNTNTRYLYGELSDYAEKLLSHFPPALSRVFFVNSGSAAADLALRLAYHHTGKSKCIALEEGYHGNTVATIAASPYKTKGKIPEDTIAVELPNAFGLSHDASADPGAYFAERVISRISEYSGQIAAFIAEPIVGCGGQVPLPPGYLQKIYPEIRAQDGVCISDEVQVGFGRLGRTFWGFELQGVVPDIVILGKPMGNGHPMGAVVTTKEIADSFESGPEFFSSFGGNPVSCAIGTAVLDVIREEGLQEHALAVGTYFKEELINLKKEFTTLADIRGEGLFLGVELGDASGNPDGEKARIITNLLKEDGVLTGTDGPYNQVIKIKPPLCFSKANVEECISLLRKNLKNTRAI